MNAKEAEAHIAEGLKFVARLRQAVGKPPEVPSSPRVIRVREIATALDHLRFIREARDDYEGFEKKIEVLLDAVCDDRWYLVIEAADLLLMENYMPRLCRGKLLEDSKFIAYSLAQIDEPKLGKQEILRVIREAYPEVYVEIPTTSNELLSKWWRDVGPVPRSNGAATKKREDAICSLITRLAKNMKAGHPEFMGPRYDPHWEGIGRYDT